MKDYSVQINAHGNMIICKGLEIRNSYAIVYVGSYNQCLIYKALGAVPKSV